MKIKNMTRWLLVAALLAGCSGAAETPDSVTSTEVATYMVFMPDYRGWGNSEGEMVVGGGYGAPDLTVDVLNALASLRQP